MTEKKKEQKHIQGRKLLGDLLIDAGLIDKAILDKALELKRTSNKRIGQILIDMGATDDVGIAEALADQLKIEFIHLRGLHVSPNVIALVPSDLAANYLLVPVRTTDKTLVVAMANPLEFYAMDDLRFITQMNVEVAVAPLGEVLNALNRFYPRRALEAELASMTGLGHSVEVLDQNETVDKTKVQDLVELTEGAPVVQFSNAILADAIASKASDIHIEPQQNSVSIRYRIDGLMRDIMNSDRQIHASVVARIKVISNMDISIRRMPQDGRARVRHGERIYDLRVSSIPTSYGEKLTIRILDPVSANLQLEDLELTERNFKSLNESIRRPEGLILVTGPTGSGKSTTLYACLNRLNQPTVNIITVEDPIEYDIRGINQVQINPKAGITFAAGLRSILRQDPDIVMVGEIRDTETAEIAFRASQTGHLVFSTLHTNDSFSSVARLLDMGVEPFMISAGLVSVLAQRLVRRVCRECRQPEPMTPQIMAQFQGLVEGDPEKTFWTGVGCEACGFTGYSGRMGIHEILMMTPSVKEVVATGGSLQEMRRAAGKFVSMTMDGIAKALDGQTSVEEVMRVVPPEAFEGQPLEVEKEPAEEMAPPEKAVAKPVGVWSGSGGKTVLVVDDSPVTCKFHRHLLEAEDYRVVTASNGVEALKIIMHDKPDLILCDQIMPEMDGTELVRKLRSQLSTRFIPIIMVTSLDRVDEELKLIEAGADDYLTKPLDARRLLVRVKRWMDRGSA